MLVLSSKQELMEDHFSGGGCMWNKITVRPIQLNSLMGWIYRYINNVNICSKQNTHDSTIPDNSTECKWNISVSSVDSKISIGCFTIVPGISKAWLNKLWNSFVADYIRIVMNTLLTFYNHIMSQLWYPIYELIILLGQYNCPMKWNNLLLFVHSGVSLSFFPFSSLALALHHPTSLSLSAPLHAPSLSFSLHWSSRLSLI